MAAEVASSAAAGSSIDNTNPNTSNDKNNNNNDNDNDIHHDPNDILNPSFIDLFTEEAPPEWTLADLQQLCIIRGQPAHAVAPFQKLPVELIEHIAYNLTHFRDIRAMANSCTFFRKILFESSNHLFWYRWSKAPHSMCRWDLGYYRQNRAYQNTIVNQQSGRRRKRCEKCMARALRGLAFKRKTCQDCWDDLGIPVKELYFVNNIDIASVPREYVEKAYTPAAHSVREYELFYFYKPGYLEEQLLSTSVQIVKESRSQQLLQFARLAVTGMSGEVNQIKRSMGYRYSQYSYYSSGPNVRREKWYAASVEDLVCTVEVIQRMIEQLLCEDIGEEWLSRGPYQPLEPPSDLYGNDTLFWAKFPRADCDLQKDEKWVEEFGEDPGNLHDCDIDCHRRKRAALFKRTWWPQAEQRFVEMLVGANAIVLTDEEIKSLKSTVYFWQWREKIQKTVEEMLKACKWVVPGVRGDWTAETVKKWEEVNGKENSEAPHPRDNPNPFSAPTPT